MIVPQGITYSLAGAPCPAGSLLSGPGVSWLLSSHLPFNHLQVGGNSLAPPPASGGRKREPYVPIQGPLIPRQSPAKKARRKRVVLRGMWVSGESTLNNALSQTLSDEDKGKY